MSDSWVLCPKCGEEVTPQNNFFSSNINEYICPNCGYRAPFSKLRKVTTEYLEEGEDEKDNKGNRSKNDSKD